MLSDLLDDFKQAHVLFVKAYRRFAAAEALVEEKRLDLRLAHLRVEAARLRLEESRNLDPPINE